MSGFLPDHGLAHALAKGRLSHAYIISGGSEAERGAAARYLAAAALCASGEKAPCGACENCRKVASDIHPDVHFCEKPADSRQITVDVVRDLRSAAYILPNEAEKSVFIVKNAHLMNPNAQNALLKVFEEPPSHAVIVLLAENAGELLPTLRSRAVTLRLGAEDEQKNDPRAGELLKLMAGGSPAEAAALCLKMDKLEREELSAFLESLRRETVECLKRGGGLEPEAAGELLRLTDELGRYMDFNVGAGHIVGALAAFAAYPKGK